MYLDTLTYSAWQLLDIQDLNMIWNNVFFVGGHRPVNYLPQGGPKTASTMVFILDGCSLPVAHVRCKQGLFPKKKSDLMTLSM